MNCIYIALLSAVTVHFFFCNYSNLKSQPEGLKPANVNSETRQNLQIRLCRRAIEEQALQTLRGVTVGGGRGTTSVPVCLPRLSV